MYRERPLLWNSRPTDNKTRNKRNNNNNNNNALFETNVSFGMDKYEIENKIQYL